jgi:hypothetical protein
MSLYTPQVDEVSAERLRPIDRERAITDLMALRFRYPKLRMNEHILQAYSQPPSSPEECVFARLTTTISADLTTKITPCQFGGVPDCSNCGCLASAGLAAIGRHRLFGIIPLASVFEQSLRVGAHVQRLRPAATQG